jgi:putative transposase
VFTDADIVATFRAFLETAANRYGCMVPVYCFMPEHLHVTLQGTDDTADAWASMVKFKQLTGYWFSQNAPGVRWQGDFHDHVVRADEDFIAHVRYTAENPVRRGLVRDWSEYPFMGAIGFDLHIILADIATDSSAKDSRSSP